MGKTFNLNRNKLEKNPPCGARSITNVGFGDFALLRNAPTFKTHTELPYSSLSLLFSDVPRHLLPLPLWFALKKATSSFVYFEKIV